MDDRQAQQEFRDRMAELIGSGRIIEAIKLVREVSGVSLKEAKEIVDRSRTRGAMPPAPPGGPDADDRWGAASQPAYHPPQGGRHGLPAKAQSLARQGRKMDAIKALREAEGVGLKEAHDRITDYLDKHPEIRRLHPEKGRSAVAIVIAVVVVVIAYVVIRQAGLGA